MSTRCTLPILLALLGCAPSAPCDTLLDLGATPLGLELTEAEHPGWGRTTCLQCHPVHTFHNYDCMSAVALDVEALDEGVDASEPTTCIPCHGDNGVLQWSDLDTGEVP